MDAGRRVVAGIRHTKLCGETLIIAGKPGLVP